MTTKKKVKKTTRKNVAEKKVAKTSQRTLAKQKQVQEVKQQQEKQLQEKQVQLKPKRRLIKKKYIVFLCLYALSFILYYSTTSLAKYASLVTQNGNISVAKWDVTLNGNQSDVLPTIVIGDDTTYQEYNLTVTSYSEIALSYSAVISNVPEGLRVTVDEIRTFSPNSSNTIIIDNLGSFSALDNDSTHVHKLTFIVPIDEDAFDSQELDIDVIFSQVEL